MNYTGINMEDVKRRNRAAILGIIARNQSISRKRIAEITGLTPASVTLLCTEMLEQKMLIETGTISMKAGAGRKQILLELNAAYCSILSVNIESENTYVVLTDLKSTLLEETVMKTAHEGTPEDFLLQIALECEKILQKHPTQAAKLAGVSVCVPGIVNKKEGTSVRAFGVWREPVPVCTILQQRLNVPVTIENNVNALAFAQLFYEGNTHSGNFLLIKWGPGVGSAVVINQHVFEGKTEKAAELGHIIVAKNGIQCSCGKKGCLETVVSYQALARIIPFQMGELEEAYTNADASQREKMDEALDVFACTITNFMTLLAPEQVVLCGKMFHSPTVRKKILDLCQQYDPAITKGKIIYTEFEGREEYIGSIACYIQNNLFKSFPV